MRYCTISLSIKNAMNLNLFSFQSCELSREKLLDLFVYPGNLALHRNEAGVGICYDINLPDFYMKIMLFLWLN